MSLSKSRVELKYLLTKEEYSSFKEVVKMHLEPFCFQGDEGSSKISTVYFDTSNYDFLRKSIKSPWENKKIRVRKYNSRILTNSNVFFEIKSKNFKTTSKQRYILPNSTGSSFFSNRAVEALTKDVLWLQVKPIVAVVYTREAYETASTDLRISFDYNMSFHSIEGEAFSEGLYSEKNVILEIKYKENLPYWLSKALAHYKDIDYSKFVECMKATQKKENLCFG